MNLWIAYVLGITSTWLIDSGRIKYQKTREYAGRSTSGLRSSTNYMVRKKIQTYSDRYLTDQQFHGFKKKRAPKQIFDYYQKINTTQKSYTRMQSVSPTTRGKVLQTNLSTWKPLMDSFTSGNSIHTLQSCAHNLLMCSF